jgi:hypothetical protein
MPSFTSCILLVHCLILSFVDSDEEEEPDANVTAPTSTSQTLVLSKTRRAAEGTLPPQQDLEMLTPAIAPEPPRQRGRGLNLAKNRASWPGAQLLLIWMT